MTVDRTHRIDISCTQLAGAVVYAAEIYGWDDGEWDIGELLASGTGPTAREALQNAVANWEEPV